MNLAYAVVLAVGLQLTPTELLRQVRDQYQRLESFSMRIEHQDSSGLYPGKYRQSLQWRKGGRFELRVTEKGEAAVPDFFADGQRGLRVLPDGGSRTEPLVPRPNSVPGWEVSGGFILGWLQDTPGTRMLLEPTKEFSIEWSFGPRLEWRGQKVRELVGKLSGGGRERTVSLFVGEGSRDLGGLEADLNGKLASVRYSEQQKNPQLPPLLGDGPGGN